MATLSSEGPLPPALTLGERAAAEFQAIRKSRTASGAAGTFALKVASTGLGVVVGVVLTRTLGATGYGVYAWAMAWGTLLLVPSVLGLDRLLVRETAALGSRRAWAELRGLLLWANLTTLGLSVGLAALGCIGAWFAFGHADPPMFRTVVWSLLLLPLSALTKLRQGALQGFRQVSDNHCFQVGRHRLAATHA